MAQLATEAVSRLRETVLAAGGALPCQRDVLLIELGLSAASPDALHHAERALGQMGVAVEPGLAEARGSAVVLVRAAPDGLVPAVDTGLLEAVTGRANGDGLDEAREGFSLRSFAPLLLVLALGAGLVGNAIGRATASSADDAAKAKAAGLKQSQATSFRPAFAAAVPRGRRRGAAAGRRSGQTDGARDGRRRGAARAAANPVPPPPPPKPVAPTTPQHTGTTPVAPTLPTHP